MPKKSKAETTASAVDQDEVEAAQGAALLAEAMASFRVTPRQLQAETEARSQAEPLPNIIVEEPELDAKAILARVASGQAMPDSRVNAPPSATIVHLVGAMPTKQNAFCLGQYTRREEMSEFRHIYESDKGERSLWWSDGTWFIGPTDAKGKKGGYIKVTENTDVPEEVRGTWSVYDGEAASWMEAPGLKMLSHDGYAKMLEGTLGSAVPVVAMSGQTPDGRDAAGFGELAKAAVINDRHTYRNADSGIALWWCAGAWFVGDENDVGTRSAFLMSEDHAFLPEQIGAVWKVAGGGSWHEAPLVTCAPIKA
jgi:hypothetical protein